MILASYISIDEVKTKIFELKKLDFKFSFQKENHYFFLKEDNEIIGYASVYVENNTPFIEQIFVLQNKRFMCNGTKILDAVIYWSQQNDFEKLCVKKTNSGVDYFFISNRFDENNDYMVLTNILKDKKRMTEGIKGTVISIFINIILSILKVFFGILGNSKGLVADGLHSLSDVVTSLVVLISIKYASVPPDDKHPYGHGQLESISGNSIGLILVITSVLLLQENIVGLFRQKVYIMPKGITLYIVGISIIVKYIMYIYKMKMGVRLNNQAIIADAKDHKSDTISSIGVLIGIILAIKINPIFDILAGIVVAILIGKEGVSIIFDTSNKIMDSQEDDFLEKIEKIVSNDERIANVHNLIMKFSGDKIYLSFHIRVDKDITVEKSHDIVDDLVKKIRSKYPNVKGITVHTDPIRTDIEQ